MEKLYVKDAEIAKALSQPLTWLKANASMLERQFGFPRIDPAVGLRHREAVEEWARERNMRKATARPEWLTETNQEDQNAF